jgi:hypothetical protein
MSAAFDYESVLSIDTIRQHTKTDDDISVTDDMIRLYRSAAFETSELFTGIPVTPVRSISEPVKVINARRVPIVRLSRPVSGGLVSFYGGGMGGTINVRAAPGQNEIPFPGCGPEKVYLIGSCDDCSGPGPLMATYESGARDLKNVSPLIVMGVLKYLAWTIKNPGDEILTSRNRSSSGESGINGTNDAAVISGAIDEWKRLARKIW